jgi:6-pyruvoyltetrahydropterin/6-carboxytetrahydropterin synthase
MSKYQSTKLVELGSCAFRQWKATHSHCQYLHGYQLKAKLWFGCNKLDDKNWCVDFGGLKELKQHLKDTFDHTTTVAADDPELEVFKDLAGKGIIQLRVFENGVGIERVAEAVYKQANDFIKYFSKDRCWVDKVEVFEHEDNSATYTDSADSLEVIITDTQSEAEPTAEELSTATQTLEQADIKTSAPKTVKDEDVPKKAILPDLPGSNTKTKGNWFKGTTWG